jgi:hypothetical protein
MQNKIKNNKKKIKIKGFEINKKNQRCKKIFQKNQKESFTKLKTIQLQQEMLE